MNDNTALACGALGVTALAGAAYVRWVKPGHDRWGASDAEVDAVLPGDDLLPGPEAQVTRAITVDAAPAEVWRWIVQIGADRAGFYSYDWLENLIGLQIHSADRIVERWQHLTVGDIVYASRDRSGGWYVAALEPERFLVLQVADLRAGRALSRDEPPGWEFQWTFVLRDDNRGGTRLLVRERVAFGNLAMRLAMAPVGTISFVMTRRMLLGVKQRAEQRRMQVT